MDCVSYDICVYHFCFWFSLDYSSAPECPVTTDLTMRVNVRTTTTALEKTSKKKRERGVLHHFAAPREYLLPMRVRFFVPTLNVAAQISTGTPVDSYRLRTRKHFLVGSRDRDRPSPIPNPNPDTNPGENEPKLARNAAAPLLHRAIENVENDVLLITIRTVSYGRRLAN